jgi:hypothetical protein
MTYDSHRGVTVLFGGSSGTGINYTDTWEWDGVQWDRRSGVGPEVFSMMGFDESRGVVVLVVTFTETDSQTWEWDGIDWVQRSSGDPPALLSDIAYDMIAEKMVLYGGAGPNSSLRDQTWLWDGASWDVASAGNPPARQSHRMVFDARVSMLLAIAGRVPFATSVQAVRQPQLKRSDCAPDERFASVFRCRWL